MTVCQKLGVILESKVVQFKKILRVMTVCQKVPKSYFQSQFWMSKINQMFSKKKLSKNINLGDHYLQKTFFSKLNF